MTLPTINNFNGQKLNNILIQQKFNNFIGRGSNYYTGKEKDNYAKGFNCKIKPSSLRSGHQNSQSYNTVQWAESKNTPAMA